MVIRLLILGLGLVLPLPAVAAGVPLLDSGGGSHGAVAAVLSKGAVKMKITGLPRLPATQPLGATFDAHVYKVYLISSADPAVEMFLVDVYPSAAGIAKAKVLLKGDLSAMGLDRVVVTAYSKDARAAFDVLTATLR